MANPKITADRLREVLNYNQETGVFTWAVSHGWRSKVGSVAGGPHSRGYKDVRVDMKRYLQHRLAWLYIHGRWPANEIDHINGNRDDNRLCNLREATRSQNSRNSRKHNHNTHGFKGVGIHDPGYWTANIRVNGKSKYLGRFKDPKIAHGAYARAAKKYFGEFARTE